MANKPFNTRIQLKHDTEAHWEFATGFSPKAGELIIYDVDTTHSSPRFKVGDGTTNVNDLPFVTTEYVETDPTVPAWAKAATKPSYTYSEVGAMPAPLFITTSNSSTSDALTYGTATTLSTGQLVFVTLNKAMAGSANATLKFGSNTAINIYLTGTTQLKAKYAAGTMLGLVYNGTNLYMINPSTVV